MLKTFISYTRELIAEGETESALNEIRTFFDKQSRVFNDLTFQSFHDQAITIANRYSTIKRNLINGTGSGQELNELNKSMLDFLRLFERRVIENINTNGEQESAQGSDFPEEESDVLTIVKTKTVDIELTLNKDFDSYTEKEQYELLKAISLLLKISPNEIILKNSTRGSVKLILNIPESKVKEIFDLVESGDLDSFDVEEINYYSDFVERKKTHKKMSFSPYLEGYGSQVRFIHPDAKIGQNVTIEPFSVIGADVVIGDDTWIGNSVTIMDGARIGKGCKIFPGAIIGAIPQDLKYGGEYGLVELEDRVIIREYVTLNRGTKSSHLTRIGSGSLLMAYTHVAHDCHIGRNCVLANGVILAGHIEIEDFVILGGLTAVHQFVKIGKCSFIGGGSLVRKDVPPFIKAAREPLSYAGINSVGLRRRGFTAEQIHHIQDIYRILFVKSYNVSQALEVIEKEISETPERDYILEFIRRADRGLIRGFQQINK